MCVGSVEQMTDSLTKLTQQGLDETAGFDGRYAAVMADLDKVVWGCSSVLSSRVSSPGH